jgi:hypothetical protein
VRVSRIGVGVLTVAVAAGGLALGIAAANLAQPANPGTVAAAGTPSPSPSPGASPTDVPSTATPSDEPSPEPTATPAPTATPSPTPVLVPDPLTGVPVKPEVASRHVVAVMIDDQFQARPQSGLSQASIVWQAPAEGGIPRYVALFSEGNPPSVGPVRSSRLYFISWASEWDAVYVHAGGSPQALALLHSSKGKGKVVYDADAFRYEGTLLYRITTRPAPHNLYTDAKNLRKLVARVGAKAMATATPVWQFAPDAPLDQRPVGGKIVVPYPENRITYAYDRATNSYLRSVSVEGKQFDAGVKPKVRIAPKNVIVMYVPFVPIGDHKHRLDGEVVGSGKAWISTNGRTIKGTWQKKSFTSPTRFFDASGKPVTLTIGQTFVQVVPRGTAITISKGSAPPASASPAPSASTTP